MRSTSLATVRCGKYSHRKFTARSLDCWDDLLTSQNNKIDSKLINKTTTITLKRNESARHGINGTIYWIKVVRNAFKIVSQVHPQALKIVTIKMQLSGLSTLTLLGKELGSTHKQGLINILFIRFIRPLRHRSPK